MAVALERFSIRGYAAKMRSADLSKCWPFDGDGRGSSLPPIPVRRFRLWSDELVGAPGSGTPAGERPDEPQLGEAAAGDELVVEIPAAEPPVEEERQAKAPAKAKQRAPKKRSIVELFAVAPPVEAVDDDTDGEDGAEESEGDAGDGGRDERRGVEEESSGASRKGKEQVKEKQMKKKSNLRKEKIKKKKKKQLKVEKLAGKKEKAHKYKMPSSVNISHILQDLVHKKWFGKASRNPVDGQKKKPTVAKSMQKKNKGKLIQTSKSISRNRKELAKLLPVHGILKNQTRKTSVKKAGTLLDAHRGNLIKLCCESAKHVSFSGKDVILGHKKSCSPMDLSQIQSLCKIFSDCLAASSAIDNSGKVDMLPAAAEGAQVVNVSDKDVATSVVERADGSLSEQKQLSCTHGHAIPPTLIIPSDRNCADTEKTFMAENLDLNTMQSNSDLISLNPGTSTLSPSLKYSSEPKALNFIYNDGLNSDAEIHVEESFPRTSDNSLLGPTRNCVSGSDTVSSLTITSTPRSQHSASCLVKSMEANGRQLQSSVDPKVDSFSHIPDIQPEGHLFPKDLMSSICSSVGSKRSGESSLTSDPGSTNQDKCIFEDFIGLPLNSRGELIKLHSGTKFGFSELYKKQNMGPVHGFSFPSYIEPKSSVDNVIMKGKFSGETFYQRDQSNWFPEQYYSASELVGFSELQGFERMKIQKHESVRDKAQFIHHDENQMRVSCHGCRVNNQHHACIDRVNFEAEGILNREFQPAIQPTMRLMGQNVTVGRSSKECQGFDDRRAWTDKDIMTEYCSSARESNKPIPKRWPRQELIASLASGTSKENPLQPLETQSSFYHMPPILPRSDPMHFECQPQWMSRNDISLTVGNHSSKVDLFRHPLPTQMLLNETSKSLFNTVSGTEPVKMRHQIPVVASHPQNVCQHMLLSSTHCKHTQSVSYSTSSTSHPPFPYQDHESIAQPSLTPSSPNLPQWLLNGNQQKKTQHTSCPPYSSPVAVHHPCSLLRTDLFPLPSPYTKSMIPFPVYNSNTSQICGSFTIPDSMVHPSIIPAVTANKCSSAVNNKCQSKNKNRNGTKSKLTYFKGLDHADRSRKRPAAKDDEFMKPAKRACSKIQEDSNASTCPRRGEQLHGYTQHNIATPESHANGNREIDVGVPVVTNEKDGLRSASGWCSLKFDGGSRSGPIKLSAGAKHILKPSLNMNQDCPRPIHSTIPFSIGTSSEKLLVSQKKSTKIYRF